ncbi:pyridoxal phosphate-dependent aminotransferase [Streptomyces sp. SR27]|uniref:pyridoxal phosphate-dependent aminotransferase n=1 Tax=Streptomyces sp. SR27 TaxID=3076630 RepID=UPI00295B2481|nr:pyridoxal phosphate-dependent aminotransferase [Streptomyces sp. SR27]MDV9187872.1 pyridoxal phosphate-dependent aminotransferase [Streptomyces sp. SR27]
MTTEAATAETATAVSATATGGRAAVSERAGRIPKGNLAELFLLARERGAIDLAVGTPGAPETPKPLVEEAVRALRGGVNQYELPHGGADIRRRIAESFTTPADPDTELTVTVGGTEALCVALFSLVDPGDEVVLLDPYYENFLGAVELAGARPKFVRLHEPEGPASPDWRLDPDELAAAFGPATRAIILNTPANPTGQTLSAEDLERIAALCERWDVTVISDEVYANLVFDDRPHLSVADVPSLRDRSVVVGSLSKSHAISGWRLGFLRARPELTRVFRRVHEITTNGAGAPLQLAAGLTDLFDAASLTAAKELSQARDETADILARMGLTFRLPEGGCFVLADIRGATDEDCRTFVRRVLEESSVLLAPGTPFFADEERGRNYVRVAFNRSPQILAAARARLLP